MKKFPVKRMSVREYFNTANFVKPDVEQLSKHIDEKMKSILLRVPSYGWNNEIDATLGD